jgi:hypothetical protein
VKSRAYENSSEKPLCELLTKIQGVTANLPSRVDDLTDTMFAGHHQPLTGRVWCLYFRGRNVSNEPIGHAWARHGSEGQQMTAQRREGSVKKSPR